MKKHKRKLKLSAKTFFIFIVFSVIVLVVSAMLQTVFLNDIYAIVKKKTLNEAMSSMLSAPSHEGDDLRLLCDSTSRYYNVSVLVADENGNTLAASESGMNTLRRFTQQDLAELYARAVDAGGTYSCTYEMDGARKPEDDLAPDRDPGPGDDMAANRKMSSLLKVAVVSSDTKGSMAIFVNALTTPLTDIKDTNTLTLLLMSCILLFVSLVLSWSFSRSISKPIVEMNNEATKLAASDFDVQFEEDSGSLELDELGSKLNYAADRLSRVDALRNELVANVSHDLRTPLTLITGYSEMMRDLPGENTPENLELIIEETKNLSSLVNDILDVSRYRTGNFTLEKEIFSITGVISSTIERISSLTEQKGYTFTFDRTEDVFVYADRTAIGRVLYNLIGNALNYSQEDRRINIRQTAENGKVRIDIMDHGSGIIPEELPYVFERYYRSSQNHVRNILGSGLGLSIVKGILEAHDAGFGVASTPGEGSDFWFSLDIADQTADN